jgi:predicted outer membrane repeat protein
MNTTVFIQNNAPSGGGVYMDEESVIVAKMVTFEENTANYGSAIYYANNGTCNLFDLEEITFEYNDAQYAGKLLDSME